MSTERPAGPSAPRLSNSGWQQLAPGVHRCVAEPDTVTIGLVVGDQHALLIDTGSHPDQGRELARQAALIAARPIDRVVITHAHRDHWFGLAGLPGAQSWGHASLGRPITAEQRAEAGRCGLRAEQLRAPDHPVHVLAAIELGGRRAELCHFGPGHSPSDLIVSVDACAVIFAGDLVESAAEPSIGPDADLSGWQRSLGSLLNLCTPTTVIVPGHGQPVDRDFAADQLEVISRAAWQARPRSTPGRVTLGVPLVRPSTDQ